MPVREIAFTCYGTTDLSRARKFYEETVGLNPPTHAMEVWVEYDLGPGGAFALTSYTKPSRDGGSIAFEVDDITAQYARYKELGITEGDFIDTPVCQMFFIRDPDENMVIIHQRKPGHA